MIPINTPKQIFDSLCLQDPFLKDDNQLNHIKNFEFRPDVKIRDLFEEGDDWRVDPLFQFIIEHGAASISRKGFYQIVGNLVEFEGSTFPEGMKYVSFKADLLYASDGKHDQYYSLTATVGVLVNSNAFQFDLSPERGSKIGALNGVNHMKNNEKLIYLKSMVGKPFYVSCRQTIKDKSAQVFWFKIK